MAYAINQYGWIEFPNISINGMNVAIAVLVKLYFKKYFFAIST